jgi:DNA-directed RNA polymerase specialized sigma24 family protein
MNNPAKEDGSRFDTLVARYYPAVYSFAARMTDDPREAIALTRAAFRNTRGQLTQIRNQTVIATILISAVIRSGLGAA